MDYRNNQLAAALRRLYGDAFLHYIFASDGKEDVSFAILRSSKLANDLLKLSLESIKSGDSSTDMSHIVTGRLTSYSMHSVEDAVNILDPRGIDKNYPIGVPRQVPVYRGSLVNFTRLKLGGNIPQPVKWSADPIAWRIQEIAIDVWPSYLLRTRSEMMPLSMTMRTHHGIQFHPSFEKLSEQILKDTTFGSMFNKVPHSDGMSSLISKTFAANGGNISSMHLSEFVNSILFHAALRLGGDIIDPYEFFESIGGSVGIMKQLMKGESADVPVLIHFVNMKLPVNATYELTEGKLRNASDFEERVLLSGKDVGYSGVVMEVKWPLRITKVFSRQHTESKVSDEWDNLMNTYSRTLKDIEYMAMKLQLGLLLASRNVPLASSSIASYYIANILNMNSSHLVDVGKAGDSMHAQIEIDDQHAKRAVAMHGYIMQHHTDKLDIAMSRVIQASIPSRNPSDGFIDAVIAWESMLSIKPSTTARIVASTTELIQRHYTDAESLKLELRKLYDDRSKLVHGSGNFSYEELEVMKNRAVEVCVQILTELYTNRTDLIDMTARHRVMRVLGLSNKAAKKKDC